MSEQDENEDQYIEEYEAWKNNCYLMYEMVSETTLLWPSLTFQWLPGSTTANDNGDIFTQNVVYGTHATQNQNEAVLFGRVQFPGAGASPEEIPKGKDNIRVTKAVRQPLEPNRIRYMPQRPSLIAISRDDSSLVLYDSGDRSKDTGDLEASDNSYEEDSNNGVTVDMDAKDVRYLHHGEDNGAYGIAWSTLNEGYIAANASNGPVFLWDIQNQGSRIEPLIKFTEHTDSTNDVAWKKDSPLFGSVSDDRTLIVYDIRDQSVALRLKSSQKDSLISLDFSPFSQYLVATSSADKTVALWDTRMPQKHLHLFVGHNGSVDTVKWSPFDDGVLASAGTDRRVIVWDLKKIGEEQSPEDAEDGAPELLFMHGGHTAPVLDFDWNPEHRWVIGSVADDNIAQIWSPAPSIVDTPKVTIDETLL